MNSLDFSLALRMTFLLDASPFVPLDEQGWFILIKRASAQCCEQSFFEN
jgi:hypothetical protein